VVVNLDVDVTYINQQTSGADPRQTLWTFEQAHLGRSRFAKIIAAKIVRDIIIDMTKLGK
jgi:hypothetical protein